ncbi:MAG: DUF5060 domain-containing protein [Lewinellaceae bacterium]|nr:DUF5060 domain-containing protein [Saprospiraceae bacterium]MCB9330850.1 DUF5060 domain-containing protein [Lewinellaceae bacterium]
MYKFYLPAISILISIGQLTAQAPAITTALPNATTIEQWGKFELKLSVTATWSNPYDYDEIRVSALFTAPSGQTQQVDGFFMQEYNLNTQTGGLSPIGTGSFFVRFSPDQTGTWKYTLSCTNPSGTGTFPEQSFTVTAPTSHGFIHNTQTNYLQFDDGNQFIPVGENIGWQNGNPYLDYKKWADKLANNGGNFFRLWQCSWGLGIEWRNGDNGYSGLRRYKQSNAFYLDWLFDYCAQRGLYVMLCLHHHGQVSSQVNPNWGESPYNTANGGPCANTWDFFTHPAAQNHTKNRLRYVLARWGYARSIMAWELFNEVDWTDEFAQRKDAVAAWHSEMSAFLKNNDPYQHLVTTSFAQDFYDPQTWQQPYIDLTQTHYYINTSNMERVLANGLRKYLNDFDKPTLTGEFGLNTSGTNLSVADPDGIHLHNSLWASLFGGGAGAGLSWWWDNYIEPKNLYYHFAPVSAVADVIPFNAANLKPTAATVAGVPADLHLTPTLQSWGALADTLFNIGTDGSVSPADAALSSFLYGAQWNTQYRRPPVFKVDYPQSGQFLIKTAGDAGQNPKIAIWLDGVKVLEQNAQTNQTYAINVPAGQHTIRVDNTGTDWILIAGYILSNLGSAVDAYVLKSETNDRVAGWSLNNRYNHDYIKTNGVPPTATGASLLVPGIQNGSYTVRYFNCLTGTPLSTETASASGGTLVLPLPDMGWDVAFLAEQDVVGTHEIAHALPVGVYPNPATSGPLTVTFQLEKPGTVTIELFDQTGRQLAGLFSSQRAVGDQAIQTVLPAGLPGGVYWLSVTTGNRVGATMVVVGL